MKKYILINLFILTNIWISAQIISDSLVSYFPFTNDAYYLSSLNNIGDIEGAALTTDRFDNPNSAYLFNGLTSWIDFDTIEIFDLVDQLTITGWVYPMGSTTDHQVIVSKWYGGGCSYVVELQPDGKTLQLALFISGSTLYFPATDTIDFNQWSFFAVTYNGDSVTVTINDTLQGIYDQTGIIEQGTSPLFIGAHNDAPDRNAFLGKIDEIRIYNQVLSESEIHELYFENFNLKTVYDTIHTTIYDTTYVYDTTYINDTSHIAVYDSISVTDTLIIDVTLIDATPPNNINRIKAYPNPTNDILWISTGNYIMMNNYELRIVNSLSQTVWNAAVTQQNYSIQLNTLGGTGLYFLQIFDDSGNLIEVRKIVLE